MIRLDGVNYELPPVGWRLEVREGVALLVHTETGETKRAVGRLPRPRLDEGKA